MLRTCCATSWHNLCRIRSGVQNEVSMQTWWQESESLFRSSYSPTKRIREITGKLRAPPPHPQNLLNFVFLPVFPWKLRGKGINPQNLVNPRLLGKTEGNRCHEFLGGGGGGSLNKHLKSWNFGLVTEKYGSRKVWVYLRRTQGGCGGLEGENPAAFLQARPIFQQPFSLPDNAQTLAGIAFRAAGKSVKNFPAGSKFAGKLFQQGISDSHSLLEFSEYPAECSQQLGRDPSRNGSLNPLVLKNFPGDGNTLGLVPSSLRNGPNTVSESTVSNTELSEFFGAHWVPESELSEFLPAYFLCAKANSPSFSQDSPSLPQNSMSSLLRNSTLETVFRPFPIVSLTLWDTPVPCTLPLPLSQFGSGCGLARNSLCCPWPLPSEI